MSDGDRAPAPRRRALSMDEYYAGVVARDTPILGRALTLVESSHPQHARQAEELLARLAPLTGRSIRVGITGAPGVGKSTFIEALGRLLIDQGRKVAVLAVDPSSSVSGGSILGDKTRMSGLSSAADSFIRPSPSAGTPGGVARKTRECLLVCEAAGYDVVLVETIGVGQSETMVADMTDCFVVLLAPGAGDELQGIKRGLIELSHLIVVNKADGDWLVAAERAASQYSAALGAIAGAAEDAVEVLTCSALTGRGVLAVWAAIERRQTELQSSGRLLELRQRQNVSWMWTIVHDRIRQALENNSKLRSLREQLENDVLAGVMSPGTAASSLLAALGLRVDD